MADSVCECVLVNTYLSIITLLCVSDVRYMQVGWGEAWCVSYSCQDSTGHMFAQIIDTSLRRPGRVGVVTRGRAESQWCMCVFVYTLRV